MARLALVVVVALACLAAAAGVRAAEEEAGPSSEVRAVAPAEEDTHASLFPVEEDEEDEHEDIHLAAAFVEDNAAVSRRRRRRRRGCPACPACPVKVCPQVACPACKPNEVCPACPAPQACPTNLPVPKAPETCKQDTECPSTCCNGYCCPGTCNPRAPFGAQSCTNVRVVKERPRYAASCQQLLKERPTATSGIHLIEPVEGQVWTVYCDMTTDGGGWTALLNPVSVASATAPGFSMSAATASGFESCSGTDSLVQLGGWNMAQRYSCGNVLARGTYRWNNVLGARDVLIAVTVQGQSQRRVEINGQALPLDSASANGAGMVCAWAGAKSPLTGLGVNACYNTLQKDTDAKTRVGVKVANALGAAPNKPVGLSLVITAGLGCEPNCQHGTGWTIQSLFVR